MRIKQNSIRYAPLVAVEIVRFIVLTISKLLWKIEFHGTENIPQNLKSGLIIVANHQSYFDPFWVCLPVKRKFRFMAWDKAFEWFLIGDLIRYLGAFPVSLERGGTRKAMKEAIESLSDGATLVVFPEGSREFSGGKSLPFKTGAVRLALEVNVPILPVTIRGANKIWAQDMKFPRMGKVKIHYHSTFEVMPLSENTDEHEYAVLLTEKLREIIESVPLEDEQN